MNREYDFVMTTRDTLALNLLPELIMHQDALVKLGDHMFWSADISISLQAMGKQGTAGSLRMSWCPNGASSLYDTRNLAISRMVGDKESRESLKLPRPLMGLVGPNNVYGCLIFTPVGFIGGSESFSVHVSINVDNLKVAGFVPGRQTLTVQAGRLFKPQNPPSDTFGLVVHEVEAKHDGDEE